MAFFGGWVPGNLFNSFTEPWKFWIEMSVGSHFGGSEYWEICQEPQEIIFLRFFQYQSKARYFNYASAVNKDQTEVPWDHQETSEAAWVDWDALNQFNQLKQPLRFPDACVPTQTPN